MSSKNIDESLVIKNMLAFATDSKLSHWVGKNVTNVAEAVLVNFGYFYFFPCSLSLKHNEFGSRIA